MDKDEIIPWDIHRILMGKEPYLFLTEVLVRTVVIYALLLVTIRILGKRFDGQIALSEMAVMVLFGAVISSPMQMHERGLLVGVIALACIAVLNRSINWLTMKSSRAENIIQGKVSLLVADGVLRLDAMRTSSISKQNLFAMLRGKQIINLGKVKRVYYEACGMFTVYVEKEKIPGLPIFPSNEQELVDQLSEKSAVCACLNCGQTVKRADPSPCPNCGAENWIQAIY
jgi:uncharacterized membrane protein YcaP (DUF421 family)